MTWEEKRSGCWLKWHQDVCQGLLLCRAWWLHSFGCPGRSAFLSTDRTWRVPGGPCTSAYFVSCPFHAARGWGPPQLLCPAHSSWCVPQEYRVRRWQRFLPSADLLASIWGVWGGSWLKNPKAAPFRKPLLPPRTLGWRCQLMPALPSFHSMDQAWLCIHLPVRDPLTGAWLVQIPLDWHPLKDPWSLWRQHL